MTHNKEKIKPIVGWAILGDKRKIISVEIGKSKPRTFNIGGWTFFTENSDLIKVRITPIK